MCSVSLNVFARQCTFNVRCCYTYTEFNEIKAGVPDIRLNPNHPISIRKWLKLPVTGLPGFCNEVGQIHPNTLLVSSSQLSLLRKKENRQRFFFCFQKRQHFLSQNHLSLCLTRLPAIFTQLKLQMIYFQLHHSVALRHTVLSITLVTTKQACQSSETLTHQTEKATERNETEKENKKVRGRENPIHISFIVWHFVLEHRYTAE